MRFLERWLADWLTLALALACALAALQAPGLAHDYAAALLQVSREARRDIEQRMVSARQFYAIAPADDAAFLEALHKVEPSNAETLAAAIDRAHRIELAYGRIADARFLLQPIIAGWEMLSAPRDDTAGIRQTVLETYHPGVSLTVAGAVYGLAGLALGTLMSRALLAMLHGLRRGGRERDRAGYAR
jgi:Protein of unknown function (DUF2937)